MGDWNILTDSMGFHGSWQNSHEITELLGSGCDKVVRSTTNAWFPVVSYSHNDFVENQSWKEGPVTHGKKHFGSFWHFFFRFSAFSADIQSTSVKSLYTDLMWLSLRLYERTVLRCALLAHWPLPSLETRPALNSCMASFKTWYMIHVLGIPWTLKPSKGSNIVFKTLYSSKTHQVWRIDAMQTISNHICCCVSAVFSPQIFVSHWWKLWRHNAPHDEWRLPTSGRRRDVETDEFFWCFVCFVYAFTAVQCWLFESMCFGVSGSVRSRLNFKKQSRKNREVFQLY